MFMNDYSYKYYTNKCLKYLYDSFFKRKNQEDFKGNKSFLIKLEILKINSSIIEISQNYTQK